MHTGDDKPGHVQASTGHEVPTDLRSLIRRRRMTRTFSGGPQVRDVLDLVETAVRAPSAGFSQGVHFLILGNEELIEFWQRSGAGAWFRGRSPGVVDASVVVLVMGDRQAYVDRYSLEDKRDLGLSEHERWRTPYWLVDAGMAAQNLLLLIEERRWGALFFAVDGEQSEYFADLGVPTTAHCVGAIAIGFRAESDEVSGSATRRTRRHASETIHVGRW